MFDLATLTIAAVVVLAVFVLILFLASVYTVVPPHQAHVVVSRGKGRKLYCSRTGSKSSYFHFPIIQQRIILPLENIPLQIDDVPLRDLDLAKFLCDVRIWLNIYDPVLAAERLGRIETEQVKEGFPTVKKDIIDLIQAVTRNASMKKRVEETMRERREFSDLVKADVEDDLKQWGVSIVSLEVIHFEDITGYHVIKDLEARQSKVIEVETRKMVAEKESEAAIVESDKQRDAEAKKAENEEAYRVRQIQKDEAVQKRDVEREKVIAEETNDANQRKVEADRTFKVGQADIDRQAAIKMAEGEAESTKTKGRADADVIDMKGEAESKVTRNKAVAEADGIDKKADALKKYNEAGITIELLKAFQAIQETRWRSLGEALKQANVNLITSGEKSLLGIPVGAELGADLGAFMKSAEQAGFPISDILKDMVKTGKRAVKSLTGQKETPKQDEPERRLDNNV